MATVRLHQLSQTFDRQVAIEDISFEIPDGEFWVLVGPSGCGKSTILRSIAGLEAVSSGEIYIGQDCVNDVPARQRDVAMVFQNYALYPHMTVAQNLAFGLQMRQAAAAEIREAIARAARMLDIEHLLDRFPRQLSGGQQQRVALGRAIVRQPKVFLLDEPLSNLDAQLRAEMRTELKQLHQQVGITTVYVTHDRTEAMTLADRIVVLHNGRIQQIGTPAEIYDRPCNRIVATFIGDPPMNLLTASYQDGALSIGAARCDCSASLHALLSDRGDRRFDLGLRAEAISLVAPEEGILQSRIEAIEPLGRETFLRVSLLDASPSADRDTSAKTTLDIVTIDRVVGRVGNTVGLRFDESSLFVFALDTGECIYQPHAPQAASVA
ncbi:MAG: ABC transporter ATP-binding protein [Geitlerinemataceae cyanobacterium]